MQENKKNSNFLQRDLLQQPRLGEKWEEIGQRVQTSGQKLNRFWESEEQDGNYG